MKLFMLDTDIASYIIRRRPESLARHFERHGDPIRVSVITAAELQAVTNPMPCAIAQEIQRQAC